MSEQMPDRMPEQNVHIQQLLPYVRNYVRIIVRVGITRRKYFPTCQVRVVRFYVSLPASSVLIPPSSSSCGPQLQALNRSVPRRTSTASSGSECSPLDQAPDQSVPHRTSTATECSTQSARKNVRENVRIGQKECQNDPDECLKICQIECLYRRHIEYQKEFRIYAKKYVRIDAGQTDRQNVKVYARKNVRQNIIYTSIYIYTSRWYVRNMSEQCFKVGITR